MPDREEGQSGRYALIADAMVSGEPEPEVMAAYAADPGSLQPAERERIQTAIQGNPALAAELEVLRSFQIPTRDSAAQPSRRPPRPGSRRRWVRSWQIGLPLAAAAAALAIYLAVPGDPVVEPASDPVPGPVARTEAPLAPASAPETTPSEVPPPIQVTEAPPKPTEVARLETPPAPSVVPGPTPPAESVPQPAPTTQPEPPSPVDEEAILVAMAVPRYVPPAGDREVFRPVQVFRDRSRPRLVALSPEHITTTPEPSPQLFWTISSVAEGEAIEFEIGPIGESPLHRLELPLPGRPGLQRLSLETLGITLPLDADLTWTVTLIRSRSDAAENPTGQGWLRRIERTPELGAVLETAALPERVRRCAEAGLWNEALAGAVQLEERYTDSAAAKALLDGLLRQGSVELEGVR